MLPRVVTFIKLLRMRSSGQSQARATKAWRNFRRNLTPASPVAIQHLVHHGEDLIDGDFGAPASVAEEDRIRKITQSPS
jgi:hypothetical protein